MARHLARTLFLSVGLAACTSSSPSTVGDDDTPLPDVHVGDDFDQGRVVSVDGDSSCRIVTLEYDAAWTCSDEQLDAVTYRNGGYETSAGPSPVTGAPNVSHSASALQPQTCAELANLRRPLLKASQRAQLEGQRIATLSEKCVARRETRYFDASGQVARCDLDRNSYADASIAYSPGAPAPGPSLSTDDDDGAQQYTTTNTQLADVDEADYVKNDAGYVYVLSATGLHVIDAWPAADSREIAFLPLPEPPTRLFLSDDKLVVYGRTGGAVGSPSAAQGCTYGYDCRAQAEPGGTMIRVFDVKDPAKPVTLRSYELSGGYVAARRVGKFVYTVVSESGPSVAPGSDLTLTSANADELERDFADKRAQSDELVDTTPDAYFLPWAREVRDANAPSDLPCDDGLLAKAAQGQSFTSLITFDLSTLGAPHRTLVATNPGFVYASASALYVATDGESGGQPDYDLSYGGRLDTSVHKFSLGGARSTYQGSATVNGQVLNQFSMDEKDGYLRVATSLGHVPDPTVTSQITVLGQDTGKLATVGTLPGLAPQEDIRSVRFDGDRMFMVTFKKTDPLFTIDLTDPRAPRVLGELKIPGFSTYMHPLDHDHVLAIGFDADDQGSFAYFDGIQIQLFDISDLTNPKLAHKAVIGTRGSASDALTNHLAFTYFAAKKKLALPMTICEGGGNGMFGSNLTFSGLMLFDVGLDTGIVESGRMPFVDPQSAQSYGDCGGWWTQTQSVVKRSIFMDDFVIGLSDTMYKVAPSADADNILKSISLSP